MDPRVRTVTAIIEADLCRDMSLAALARSARLSPSHLRYLFKAETGMTPAQYLKLQRMEKARRLTETTFLSMKVIMRRVGLTDRGHFARSFKEAYGLMPVQYRAHFHSAAPKERATLKEE